MTSFRIIQPYLAASRHTILFGLFSLIVVDFLQLLIPRVIKQVVDDLTLFQADHHLLFKSAVTILLLGLVIAIFRFFWRRCLLGSARKTEESLRNQLFTHLQTLSPAYFDHTRTGDLMAHATNDILQIRMAAGMGLVALNDAVFLGSAAIGFMMYIHLELTLYVLIPMPLIVLGSHYFGGHMHRQYKKVQATFGKLTETVRERFAGIRVIFSFNAQCAESKTLEKVSATYMKENIDLVKITGVFFPLMIFLTPLSLAIVLFQGGRQTIFARITTGDFVAFISYLGVLTWPMMALGWVTNLIQRGRASLDRLNVILSTTSELVERDDARPISAFQHAICVEDVDFSYDVSRPNVLTQIRLDVQKGKTLGIVGPSGSGKTTLVQLFMRLYDVRSGAIRIDGTDLRDLKQRDLRALMALAPQEPFLFDGTISENITLGRSDITADAISQVVRMAELDTTLSWFPDGLDTLVGERGVILSGGQKQRIGLARAFLEDAPILILDDPVSQVDTWTAARIIDRLKAMAGSKTLIIVSHRLAAVRHADTLIRMENGRIQCSGTHSWMMQNDSWYARAYRLQELEQELEDAV
ncbi:ABC transporter ATP-binding protein/permease [Desulfosarcina sp. OttesenSCG-928-G17]|nr:ABC transporter ATP-binding protein/permease [Desulfosarcina sp. OttesenSCG-928-G17]